MRICICTAVYNIGDIVRYVIRSILKAIPRNCELKPIVIDSGSSDNSLEIAISEYRAHGYEPRTYVGRLNVSQARNKCLELAINEGCDVLVIVDHDVVLLKRNAVELALEFLKNETNAIVAIPYSFVKFRSIDELTNYIESKSGEVRCLILKPVPWTVTGFLIIPSSVMNKVKFVEEMNFRDDTLFGLRTWSKGIPIYMAESVDGSDISIDVSLGDKVDLYSRMSVSEYMRYMKGKVLSDVYRCASASIRGCRDSLCLCLKLVGKYLVVSSWILGFIAAATILPASTMLSIALSILASAAFTILIAKEYLKLGAVKPAIYNAIKISLFSLASILLFLPIALTHVSVIRAVLRAVRNRDSVRICTT